MTRRFMKIVGLPLLAALCLQGLEHLAQGQTGGTFSGGGSGGGGGSLSSGSSFSGGGGGGSISGGGGGISGGGGTNANGQGFSGGQGSFSGTTNSTTTTGRGSAGGATVVPSTSNVFGANFGNPWSRGLPGATGTGTAAKITFGVPLYATTTTTGRTGNTGRAGTGAAGSTVSVVGFNSFGMYRDAPFSAQTSEDLPVLVRPSQLIQSEVIEVLQGSSRLASKESISASINGATVILRGQVASERERSLAEQLVRLTPGVRAVSNELTVVNAGKQ